MSVFDVATLRAIAREEGSKCLAGSGAFYGILSRVDAIVVDEAGMQGNARERVLRVTPGDLPDGVGRESVITTLSLPYRIIGVPDEAEDDGFLHYRVTRA